MCGIIARISENKKSSFHSAKYLKDLEYRGYDSTGFLLWNGESNEIIKKTGCFTEKEYILLKEKESYLEVGHTRWATHGKVNEINSHPHQSGNFSIVLNGIIENYLEIKKNLIKEKIKFYSETDTEVLVKLIHQKFIKNNIQKPKTNDFKKVIIESMAETKGQFSFVLTWKNYMICYRNQNPLILGKNQNEFFISSDFNIIQNSSRESYEMKDQEIIILNHLNLLDSDLMKLDWKKSIKQNYDLANKLDFYMRKEILEQKNINKLITNDNMNSISYLLNQAKKKEIILLGAGSSYHAALYMHYKLLKKNILSRVILASEVNNYIHLLKNKLIVVFSQSGETADLIYPLKKLQNYNEIFAIVNTKNSSLDRLSNKKVYLNCGKEIAVASTKAFTFQLFIADLIFNDLTYKDISLEFEKFIYKTINQVHHIINHIKNEKYIFIIGRNEFYPIAIESALKIKEITYKSCEGFAGGELKHGSLAMISEGTPVLVLGSDIEIISNAIEVKTRGGIVIGVGIHNYDVFDYFIKIPNTYPEFFSTIVSQVLSLELSLELGLNPDKPRNLAKSVTVK